MSQYPYIKLVVPTALKQYKNGQLAESVLASVKTGGKMYAPVAAQFNKMYDAALAAGFKLKNVGDYRSFQGQLSMFMDRYVTTDTGTGVTRQYEGKTWWLKKGKAPSAAPDPTGLKGSNHGWGLAIDLGYDVNGTWECLWYSGILRASSIPNSVEINIPSGIDPDGLIVHVETQKDQKRLSVTPSPEMPGFGYDHVDTE